MIRDRRVYVVDDDASVRSSLVFFLKTLDMQARPCSGGREFLENLGSFQAGAVLLDLRMPETDGLAVLEAMGRRIGHFPVIVMTGHGDIGTAVRAMKLGASDFLEKPFEEQALTEALDRAFGQLATQIDAARSVDQALQRLQTLTPREADVLGGLAEGLPNKVIAYRLNLSVRTVEMHRASMMDRLQVRSLSEALRLVFLAGGLPHRPETPGDE